MVMTTRRGVLGLAAGAGLATVLAACNNTTSDGTSGAATAGTATLNLGSLTAPSNMDPVNAVGSNLPFFQALYDNLVNKAPDGTLTPMLATKWSWSSDNKTLHMTLRTDVKFSDGSEFDATAARKNLIRYRDAKTAGSPLLAVMKDVKVVDKSHIDIVLSTVWPGFVQGLWEGAGFMASPKSIAAGTSLRTKPVGSGPYTYTAAGSSPGSKWVLTASKDYWGTKPKFKTINYTTYSSETAIVNGLKSGQLDTAVLQQQSSIASVKNVSSLKLTPYPFDMISISILDHDGKVDKPLADVRVRQAMNYAINRASMVKHIMQGNATATCEPVSPQSPAYVPKLKDYYDYNPAKAKQLLAAAGYPHGFSITMPQYTPIATDAIATSVKHDLGAVGIKVTWVPIDNTKLYSEVFTNKKYSTIVFSNGLPDDGWDLVTGVVQPLVSIGKYDDKVGLGIIAKITAASTDEERDPLYQDFATELVKSAWTIPMYLPGYQLVTNDNVVAKKQSGMAVPSIYNYSPAT